MIARATGEVKFLSDGVRIGPSLTREEFLASALARESREAVRNEPYCTFELPRVQFDAHQFAWSLSFHGSRLQSVSIACTDQEFGSSWSDWSEERELARKRCHDALLQSVLGPDWQQQRFTWGHVYSVFDPRSGGSSIGLNYGNVAQHRRGVKLWHLLVAIGLVGLGLGMMPQRTGIPDLLIEGILIIVLIGLDGTDGLRRFWKK